ncbi:hypothetical protein GH733_010218 [Mirounga leonina]|nr:hypothetical protein GH733_010218 [Mirounga leonina]
MERIASPTESEFELRATRGRGRIACTGSAPRVAALGRRARSAAFPRALGGSGVSCCRRCCRRPVFRQRRTPPGSVSRDPQTSASSRAVGSVSAAVLRRSRGARGPGEDGEDGESRRRSARIPGPAPGSVSGPSAGCGSLGRRVLEKGAPGPIPRPQPARGEHSGRANDQQRVRRRAGRAAACVPGPEGRPGPRDFHALTRPRLRALSPPEPFIGCLRSDLRSVNPSWRHLSLPESVKAPGVQSGCLSFRGRGGGARGAAEGQLGTKAPPGSLPCPGRAGSAALLGADGDCPLDGFAGRAAGSTPVCPAGP